MAHKTRQQLQTPFLLPAVTMANKSEDERWKREREHLRERDAEIKRLKLDLQRIEQKNQLKQQVTMANKSEDEQWKREMEHLREKEEEIKQMKLDFQKIEASHKLDQEIEYFKLNNSIEGLWDKDDNARFVISKLYGQLSKSHVDPQRLPASAEEADFLLVTAALDKETLMTASSLLATFGEENNQGCRVQTYGGKADVQEYVRMALIDALKILNRLPGLQGIERTLRASHQSAIFSNRLDHLVVVVGSSQTPIFVVETECPVDKIDDNLWGQIYDYHGIMRVVGHCNPFVVLSTFEQSWITWVQCNENCAKIAGATDYKSRFDEPLQQLRKQLSPPLFSGTPSLCEPKEGDVVQHCSSPTTSRKKDRADRRLCLSEPYKSSHLVKVFVNAILCSLCNFQRSASIVRNDQGYQLTDKHVLTLTQKDYNFETISMQVAPGEFKASNFAQQVEGGFHILDLLGSGRTSKVFLATTPNGHECVLKMYVRKFDEHENYMPIDTKQFNRDAKKSTSTEQKMYESIYGITIPVIELFNHLCLVLPYIRPVHDDERADALEDLDKLLRQKFRVEHRRSTKYYKFRRCDQAWRHCGYMCKNQEKSFILYDLANLGSCKTEEDHDHYIERHIKRLSRD